MPEQKIGNWGRWGPDDQRGTLNYLSSEVVKRAAGLVKKGKVYSLAVPLERDGPIWPGRNRTWHCTSYHNDPAPGGLGGADDMLVMHTHGTTHVDSLAHVWYDNRLYNGHSSNNVTSAGAAKNAIDNARWIVGRGVLLDVAGYKGVDHLEKGYAITPEDLEGCARTHNVSIEPGDILLIRTGWYRLFSTDRALFDSGEPGPGIAAVEWFAKSEVCAIGADNGGVEVLPPEGPGGMVVHYKVIRDLGAYLMEYLDLEELARDRIYEFLFVATPLRIVRGIGSPLNPLAIA